MSKINHISLRTVMHLPTSERLAFILVNYPQMDCVLVGSLLTGKARI